MTRPNRPPLHLIFRPHYSHYWPKDYAQREEENYRTHPLQKVTSLENAGESPWILLSNSHFQENFVPLSSWENLKLVIHSNSGFDSLASVATQLKAHRIPVILGNRLRRNAVVEYYLQCLLRAWGEIPSHLQWDPQRQYPRTLIDGRTIILLGQGHIGSLLENVLTLLGANVQIYDPKTKNSDSLNFQNLPWESADAVLICCSLTDSSRNLLNANLLKRFAPHTVLINAARGQILCTQDLLTLLPSRPQWKVFLDVFEKEPTDFSLWRSHPQVHCTSHIAGVYDDLARASLEFEQHILQHFFEWPREQFLTYYQAQLWQP